MENQNQEAENNSIEAVNGKAPSSNLKIIIAAIIILIPVVYLLITQLGTNKQEDAVTVTTLVKTISNPEERILINESLEAFNNQDYSLCIELCYKVLVINPNSAVAYNNLCASYNVLGEWDKAIDACSKAVMIEPSFQLARNNLSWAFSNKDK